MYQYYLYFLEVSCQFNINFYSFTRVLNQNAFEFVYILKLDKGRSILLFIIRKFLLKVDKFFLSHFSILVLEFGESKTFQNISVIETMQIALELGDNACVILRELIKQSLNGVNEKNADEHIQRMLVGMCSKLIQGVDQVSNVVLDAIFFFIVQPQKVCFFL